MTNGSGNEPENLKTQTASDIQSPTADNGFTATYTNDNDNSQ